MSRFAIFSRFLLFVCFVVATAWAQVSTAQVSVLTQHNDNSRTGQNLNETILNTSNVNASNFGKLFARQVDGNIFAQPLYVPSLTIGGKTRNVVYVATAHNTVFAFDADDPAASSPLWAVNLGNSVPSQDICNIAPPDQCPYTDVVPEIGIISTPVIDPSTQTLYVVATTKDASSNYHWKLHALYLITGTEMNGGPTEIAATGFNPFVQLNRPSLLLANGRIYVAFGSVGDYTTWHGWMFAYNASTLQRMAYVNFSPNGYGAGLWAAGNGLIADSNGDVYGVTSNGTFDLNTGGADYASTYLRLDGNSLAVLDSFSPSNQSLLNGSNKDLGSGGSLLIPGTTMLVGSGKDALFRLVDTTNMGGYNPTQDSNRQNFTATNTPVFGAPVFWTSPTLGPLVYLWGQGDFLKAWSFNKQTLLFNTSPVMQSTTQNVSGWPDTGVLSISANKSVAGTGIVWAARPYSGLANPGPVPGILHAFDANNLSHELWNSKQIASRDDVGNYAKFNPPTVANGKVYLGTFSNQLLVYGLNPGQGSGIGFVQVASATPQSPTQSVPVTFPGTQLAGDLNVVVVGWNDTTSTVQSVTDTTGNTYSLAVGPTTGTALRQSIYYGKNIKAGNSNKVTITFNAAAAYPDVRILEYTGLDPNNPLDVTSSATGSGTAANSGSATTTGTNDLIFGANTVATSNSSGGPSFTVRIVTPHDGDLAEDRTVTTSGSYNATATLSGSGPWVMQMVAFKAQASTGNAPTVSSVTPNSGPSSGGTPVTIGGTNFAAGASVTFGGSPATNVVVVSSSKITANTPAHAVGAVDVTVTNPNGQNGTLPSGFTYTSSGGGIAFVQVAYADPQSPASTVSVPFSKVQTAGNLNVVVIGWNDTVTNVQSVTDTQGNAYTPAIGPTSGTGLRQSIYYASGIAAGTNTVTVKFTQAATYSDVRVLEYSGITTLDVTSGGFGKSAAPTSGAATTTAANELIFGADTVYTGNKAPGTGFTARVITSPDSDLAEDRIVTSTGSYSATATLGTSGNWVMQMATFK